MDFIPEKILFVFMEKHPVFFGEYNDESYDGIYVEMDPEDYTIIKK